VFIESTGTVFNSTAGYQCMPGYQDVVTGSDVIMIFCEMNGTWASLPTCVAKGKYDVYPRK